MPVRVPAPDTTVGRARRARWLALMAILLVMSGRAPPQTSWAQTTSDRLRQCWPPAVLKGQAEEKAVVQNVEWAYKRLPAERPQATPLPRQWRGAIRRVDLPPGIRKVALTFDLCEQPHEIAGYDGPIVDFLRETKTKATFFAGGKWMASHEERARQIIADPLFEVGNHTWEHRNLRWARGQRLLDEINAPQIAYSKIYHGLVRDQCVAIDEGEKIKGLAVQPAMPWLFRFPFGACDTESLRAVGDAGLLAIQWDLSSGDPMRSHSVVHMAAAVVRGVRPGSIVLFHANGRGWRTAGALRFIIPELRARGYEFVTVSDLLNSEGARPAISQTCYDVRPGDTNRYDSMAKRLEAVYVAFDAKFGSRAHNRPAEEPLRMSPSRPASNGDLGQMPGGDERSAFPP